MGADSHAMAASHATKITRLVDMNLAVFEILRAESYPQRSTTPRDTVMRMVGECRIYVGILGARYGTQPEGEPCSVTEMEFNAGHALHKHVLLYLKKRILT